MITTIQINNKLKQKLDKLKIHHRESYNELIERIIKNPKKNKMNKENLIETIEVLSDPKTMRDIAEALERIKKENLGIPISEVRKELAI